MVIFRTEQDINTFLAAKRTSDSVIGFVPTMGALHAGHRYLIETAKENGDFVVCSIFVNPTQFNDKNDFEKYPVTEEADIEMLLQAGCDVLFLPSVDVVYPSGQARVQDFDFGYLDSVLEGAQRAGHFKGVGQVVSRMLDIVNPHRLYLGQKDYQQCMVIKSLLSQEHRNEVQLVICPTVREADGLAMSSRNVRLTDPQRALAVTIYQCLISIQSKQHIASFDVVQKECMELLQEKGLMPEYVALADAQNLTLLSDFDADKPMVALIAAKIGEVRLIDNLVLNEVMEAVPAG